MQLRDKQTYRVLVDNPKDYEIKFNRHGEVMMYVGDNDHDLEPSNIIQSPAVVAPKVGYGYFAYEVLDGEPIVIVPSGYCREIGEL